MARVTDQDVRAIIDRDIGNSEMIPTMVPFIEAATNIIDRLDVLAAAKGIPLTASELREVERWFAAYLALHKSPQFNSKSTQGASGSFVALDYLETAKNLDPSGSLTSLLDNKTASGAWLGKPRRNQIPYRDRNY